MKDIVKVSRRDFIKTGITLGGGLILACHFKVPGPAEGPGRPAPFAPNAFLRVGNDGSVTVIVNKSEMGQGVYTALPMIIAEELECDWKMVRVAPAPVAAVYNHTQFGSMMTGGSTSVRTEWERLAQAGAAARAMLCQAAAQTWKADAVICRTENGQVVHPDGRTLTYGELADKAAKLSVPNTVKLKDPSRYTLIGQPIHRLDSPAKVNGSAVFGIDVRLDNLLVAVIARPPVFGATLKSVDDTKAKAVAGVQAVVTVPAGVAVVADGFWPALQGRPKTIGHHRDAGRYGHHGLDTGNRLGLGIVHTFQGGTEDRRASDHGHQQVIKSHVDPENSAAVDLGRTVETVDRLADERIAAGVFEFYRIGHRELRGLVRQFAIGECSSVRMHHLAIFRPANHSIGLPGLGRRLAQHCPGSGAGLSQPLPFGANAGAATGHHATELGMVVDGGYRRRRHPYHLPIAFQLLGNDHRQCRIDPLPHLRFVDDDGHRTIVAHAQKSIGRKGGRPTGPFRRTRHFEMAGQDQPAAQRDAGLDEISSADLDDVFHWAPPFAPAAAW